MLFRSLPFLALLLAVAGLSLPTAIAADRLGTRSDLTPAERNRAISALTATHEAGRPQPFEALAGGAMTHHLPPGPLSFSQPNPLLTAKELARFDAGRRLFRRDYSLQSQNPVLGPLFNAASCEACHQRDGRGDDTTGRVLRLYSADGNAHPVYGRQLQDRAIPGVRPEGAMRFKVSRDRRAPELSLAGLADGPPDNQPGLSLRMAPALIGLGLIAAISTDDISLRADPDDLDGDGISGQLRQLDGGMAVGRFGWKAEAADIPGQIAAALATDMGLSSPAFPESAGDCGGHCLPAAGLTPEVSDAEIRELAFYIENLAVPRRWAIAAPDVLAGREIFEDLGCARCHHPNYVTMKLPDAPARSYQLIWPYSDFLLHDMGEALADGGAAHPFAREWRTPPLWGLGLAGTVNDGVRLLHDGRAASIEEAILWHGGEASAARAGFENLDPADSQRLLAFLNSL